MLHRSFKALRFKNGSCAPAYGSAEKIFLKLFYALSKLRAGTTKVVP